MHRENNEKMPKTFVLHDESVNTYGFRMLTSGANLEEFRKNPIMLYNHDDWSMPIGRWENIRIEGDKILADAVFDLGDPRGRQVAEKVEGDFLRMASIGAWAPELSSDDPLLKLEGQTGVTVLKWTVREASIVGIGSNHNALALYDRATSNLINLHDQATLIRIMDDTKPQAIDNPLNDINMTLNQVLGLADKASHEEQVVAVEAIKAEHALLKDENAKLKAEVEGYKSAKAESDKAEAVALVDAAIKDGRIDASGRETYLKLFDGNHEGAKQALAAIPHRQSVQTYLQEQTSVGGVALADINKLSWDELHRRDLLLKLKDQNLDIFKEKFREKYGREWSN